MYILVEPITTQPTEPPTEPTSTEPVSTTTKEPPVLENWAIAVIACGAAVLLFIIVMICILVSKAKSFYSLKHGFRYNTVIVWLPNFITAKFYIGIIRK